ncbi:copine-9 isoform X2 [Folsomia candida]|uniref:copine-9 isoform X2 n=1 Tax=Folsomia candida TaxID=158441 RepID=UPI001604FC0D|nr:copine-9 isoform X2 [Folsomia candida]
MSLPTENSIYYNTRAEIFMVLKDVNTSYTLTPSTGELKSSANIKSQQVTVFWRPPGALQWLEKYKTEILPGKSNLQFLASLLFDFDEKDATSISLKFEMRHLITSKKGPIPETMDVKRDEMSLWSTAHTTLDKILVSGSKGLELYLSLDFGVSGTKYLTKQPRKLFPGNLLIRGEILHPSPYGVLLQFGLQSEKSTADYFVELHKLNQDNAFELSHPYTLVYRSELDEVLANFLVSDGKRVYFNESRLSNGDPDRVLKIDIFKKESFDRKGFALTTLGTLLKDQYQELIVDRVDSFYPYKKKEIKVILKLCSKIPNHPIEYYFNHGWKIVPVFAIDYSRSNWNETLHKRILHDSKTGRAPYEEALEFCSEALSAVAYGHAVFYGFGCPSNAYMNAYRPGHQFIASALKNYHDGLCLSLMSALSLSHHQQGRTGVGGGASSQSSSTSSTSASSAIVLYTGSLLSPLLSDLVTLISARKCAFEYYTVVILTDGQFTDCTTYMTLLKELSILPVSLIFIGIGLGDLRLLLQLDQAWSLSFNGIYLSRKFVHLMHFRSRSHWEAALTHEQYRTDPKQIFTRELLTTVQEHALDYFKRCSEYKK